MDKKNDTPTPGIADETTPIVDNWTTHYDMWELIIENPEVRKLHGPHKQDYLLFCMLRPILLISELLIAADRRFSEDDIEGGREVIALAVNHLQSAEKPKVDQDVLCALCNLQEADPETVKAASKDLQQRVIALIQQELK